MKKHLFTILLLSVFLGLISTYNKPIETPVQYSGAQLAKRSRDPRITEIAHIDTNPTLNSFEIEAKTLWDSLFTSLFNEAQNSESITHQLKYSKLEHWTGMTPKEITTKSFNGAYVFFMQNLENFEESRYMCATYNSKIYILPNHYNHLIEDMNISTTPVNIRQHMRRIIDLSISSPTTIIDSSAVTAIDSVSNLYVYNIWEQRNGLKHRIKIETYQDTLMTIFHDILRSHEFHNDNSVILDEDKRPDGSYGGKCIKPSPFLFLSLPERPVLQK